MTSATTAPKLPPVTSYLVLKALAQPAGAYAPIAENVEAQSAAAAIRHTVEGLEDDDANGTFVAVPERSWAEQRVTVESKPKVTLSDLPKKPRLVGDLPAEPLPARAAGASA